MIYSFGKIRYNMHSTSGADTEPVYSVRINFIDTLARYTIYYFASKLSYTEEQVPDYCCSVSYLFCTNFSFTCKCSLWRNTTISCWFAHLGAALSGTVETHESQHVEAAFVFTGQDQVVTVLHRLTEVRFNPLKIEKGQSSFLSQAARSLLIMAQNAHLHLPACLHLASSLNQLIITF